MKLHPAVKAEIDKSAAHYRAGRLDLAEAAARRALARAPGYLPGLINLGAILEARGRSLDAIAAYDRVLAVKPDEPAALNNLANAYATVRRYADAEAVGRRLVAVQPGKAANWATLAYTLTRCDKFVEAAEMARRAIEIDPSHANTYNTLGLALHRRGLMEDSIAAFRQAAARSRNPMMASNALFDMHFLPRFSLAELAAEAESWNQTYAVPVAPPRASWPRAADPAKPLRVGFVSCDLKLHPVAYFFAAMLEARGPDCGWTAVGYSNLAQTDAMTDRIKAQCELWRDIKGVNDEQVAAQIRRDGIDILFDLNGHTGENRLAVFAHKPAPVQASWIGYFDTTGLDTMDYLLADATCVPPWLEPYFKESIIRLPDGFLCYEPPADAPAVAPLPARTAGHVTFGTANQAAKIRPEVAALWGRLFERVPDARLVVKARGLSDPETREAYLSMFEAQGLPRSRVSLEPPGRQVDILAFYGRVDISLDPFPCAGGTTTCEALWMGVPVVTLLGERFCNRHSASHLHNIGLDEIVAAGPDQYLDIAAALALDLDRLEAMRAGLRPRMAASPLTDTARFVRHFSEALRGMWTSRCEADAARADAGPAPRAASA